MHMPRRPALERPGIPRVSARAGRTNLSPDELLDEIDSQAELYERSI
jgi:hypothetical protein